MARTAAMRARATAGSAGGGVSALAPWLAFAEQRGLRLLEAEILLALGETQLGCDPDSARGRLMQAVDVAGRIGAHHVRGRALLFLHDQPRGDPAALKIAISDLDEAAPWRCRALVALARRLAEDGRERERALELCASALCRFGDMDLPRDEANARGLLWKLSARG
jgi:hypothetical protein